MFENEKVKHVKFSEDDLYEGLEAGEDDGSGDRWE
jgi:hypothetical protein